MVWVYFREVVLSACQAIEEAPKSGNTLLQIRDPCFRTPDFDADGGTDDKHIAPLFDPQKLSEAFGNQQTTSTGDFDRSLAGGEESAEKLQFSDPALEFAGADFPPHQIHTGIQFVL